MPAGPAAALVPGTLTRIRFHAHALAKLVSLSRLPLRNPRHAQPPIPRLRTRQGTMSLVVNTDEEAFIRIAVTSGANKGFQFKTHPNIDKTLYSSSNVLGLKDPARPFPTGSELGVLKWRFQTKEVGGELGSWGPTGQGAARRGVVRRGAESVWKA